MPDLKDLIIARQDHSLEELIVTSYPYVYAEQEIDDCIEDLKDYSEDSIPVLDNEQPGCWASSPPPASSIWWTDAMGEDYAMLAGLPRRRI